VEEFFSRQMARRAAVSDLRGSGSAVFGVRPLRDETHTSTTQTTQALDALTTETATHGDALEKLGKKQLEIKIQAFRCADIELEHYRSPDTGTATI